MVWYDMVLGWYGMVLGWYWDGIGMGWDGMVLGWDGMVLVWYLMVAVGADGRGCWTGGCFFERQRIPADEYGARVSGSYSRKSGPNATPAQSGEERFRGGGIPGPQNRELCLCVCGCLFTRFSSSKFHHPQHKFTPPSYESYQSYPHSTYY